MAEELWSSNLDLALIARRDHPLASRRITSGDLTPHPIVAYSIGPSSTATQELNRLLNNGLILALQTNSTEIAKRMIASGVGIGFLPVDSVIEEIRGGSLVQLDLGDYRPMPATIAVVRWRGRELSTIEEEFLSLLREDDGTRDQTVAKAMMKS